MACTHHIVRADTLEMADGTTVKDCFVRDEGIRLQVWDKLADVGGPGRIIPRSQIKSYKVERGAEWDTHPRLPDLSVTFIEMNPKLAGLHGRVDYNGLGSPTVAKGGALLDIGDRARSEPEAAVKNLKLNYKPGEEITFTAHVKNLGFAPARAFTYMWLIDNQPIATGQFTSSLSEMEETTFLRRWQWQDGFHHVSFKIISQQPEIATINNEATDPLWGWGLVYVVHKGRVQAWHQNRTAYGTFSFEDFYRWHVDLMNLLFRASVYPSAPQGIQAAVRLDRIIYTDDIEAAQRSLLAPDGLRYYQGIWTWVDDQDKNRNWQPPTKEWRNQTEWSLPHELGHQLGLTDLYQLEYAGDEQHVMPDNGEKITTFMPHPVTMMHWHGPQVYSELDAGYFNMTWNKPRGYFGDYYFAIPSHNYLRIVDVNDKPVPGAKVEIFQRGTEVDSKGQPVEDQGVRYYPVVEDGRFDKPLSREPVIVGTTGADGVLRLPNRPVEEVRTLNGFQRQPNPFGNINVVGERGLMLVRVTKNDQTKNDQKDSHPAYFWLNIYDYNVAWFRGHKDWHSVTLKTPFGSMDSPPAPRDLKVTALDDNQVRVTWNAPPVEHEQQYLNHVIGYRVYRRIGADGLNDRPWFPVATLAPETHEAVVDLRQFPKDVYWYSKVNRFAVSAIGDTGIESELTEVVMPAKK